MNTYADEPMPRGNFALTGVDVVPIDRSVVNGKAIDRESEILTYSIRFDVHSKFTLLDGTKTKPFKITNPTDVSNCSLTVNKPIRFNGKVVPAGENLMKFQRFDGSHFNISMPSLNPFAINSVRISDDFDFAPDTYTLRFQWKTGDGITISDNVTVRIDIGATKKGKDVFPSTEEEGKAQQ